MLESLCKFLDCVRLDFSTENGSIHTPCGNRSEGRPPLCWEVLWRKEPFTLTSGDLGCQVFSPCLLPNPNSPTTTAKPWEQRLLPLKSHTWTAVPESSLNLCWPPCWSSRESLPCLPKTVPDGEVPTLKPACGRSGWFLWQLLVTGLRWPCVSPPHRPP